MPDNPFKDIRNKSDEEIKQFIMNNCGGPNVSQGGLYPLHIAAYESGYKQVISVLIDMGANINALDSQGSGTPLHYATMFGAVDAIETLLSRGANVNATNANKATPLHLATQKGKIDSIKVLLSHEASVNAKEINGRTPLHIASAEGFVVAVNILIAHKAEVNATDSAMQTPLHDAVRFGKNAVVKALLANGADTSAVESRDETPLLTAFTFGNLDAVIELLPYVSDINAKYSSGFTLLEIVTNKHWERAEIGEEIASLLVGHGADVTINGMRENLLDKRNRGVNASIVNYLYSLITKIDQIFEQYQDKISQNPNDATIYFNRGYEFYQQFIFAQAITDFSQCLLLDPAYLNAYELRGATYQRLLQWDKSIEDYNQAINIDSHYKYYNARGLAYRMMGDLKLAKQDFEKVLSLQSNDTYANEQLKEISDECFQRGCMYFNNGLYDQAIVEYSQSISLNPNNLDALVNRGETYQRIQQWDNSIDDYNQAIRVNPRFEYFNGRGTAYRKKGNIDLAKQDFEKVLTLHPNDIYAKQQLTAMSYECIQRGKNYYNDGLYDQAIVEFGQSISINPNNLDAFVNRGGTYQRIQQWDNSIEDYNHAIRIFPRYEFFYGRGTAYRKKGNLDLAKQDFEKVLTLHRNDSYAIEQLKEMADECFQRGYKYFNDGLFDQAIFEFSQSISFEPKNLNAYELRGATYQRKLQWDKSIEDYNQAIKIDPHYKYYNARGLAYRMMGNFKLAKQDFEKVLSLQPKDAYAKEQLKEMTDECFQRGNKYFNDGLFDQAIVEFSQLISLEANHLKAYEFRGEAYQRKLQWDKSIEDYNQAIKIDPCYKYFNARGLAYRMMGDLKLAKQDFKKVLSLKPDDEYARTQLKEITYGFYKKILIPIIVVVIVFIIIFAIKPNILSGSKTVATDAVNKLVGNTQTATVTSNVRFRAKPSTEADVITTLNKDEIVTITGKTQDGWVPVSYKGNSGWVRREYLQFDEN